MSTPEEIRADAERHREQLAATVDELGRRLDVRTRAQAQVRHLRQRAGTPRGIAVVGGVVVTLALLVVVRRRTHH